MHPHKQPTHIGIASIGACLLPHEFSIFTGELGSIEVHDARESPRELHARLAAGTALVLTGPYAYADAIYRYCQRFEHELVASEEFAHIEDRPQRSAAFTEARRRKLHRLLLVAQGDCLLNVQQPPETAGLQDWLQETTGDARFLIPLRRLQRILTDIGRASEGIRISPLDETITIRPHVYVPADQSVPAMFVAYRHLIEGKRVLDMGTGTGVLALLVAQLGAEQVIATDINPKAVANATLNVVRLGLEHKVEVRGPADLFSGVSGETFDVVIFNAPWIQGEPQTLYDTANYDPGYRVLGGFLQDAPEYLAPDGVILLQYSNISQRRGNDSIGYLDTAVAANSLEIVSRQQMTRRSRVVGGREDVFIFEIKKKQRRK